MKRWIQLIFCSIYFYTAGVTNRFLTWSLNLGLLFILWMVEIFKKNNQNDQIEMTRDIREYKILEKNYQNLYIMLYTPAMHTKAKFRWKKFKSNWGVCVASFADAYYITFLQLWQQQRQQQKIDTMMVLAPFVFHSKKLTIPWWTKHTWIKHKIRMKLNERTTTSIFNTSNIRYALIFFHLFILSKKTRSMSLASH